ncbi:hypothetical protein [Brucella intermedia]|nr:hypothetical protein [Brucella intermedia]NYD84298.1 hypothetical protein [Brucella intermedia]
MKPSRFFYLATGAAGALMVTSTPPGFFAFLFAISIAAALTFDWNDA